MRRSGEGPVGAGRVDAGRRDAGCRDAGRPDTVPTDAGRRAALRACALAWAAPLAGCGVLRNDAPSFDASASANQKPALWRVRS